ncbi:hypothetical protein ACW9H6_07285 [Pseudomonas sp. SDO528_S397]
MIAFDHGKGRYLLIAAVVIGALVFWAGVDFFTSRYLASNPANVQFQAFVRTHPQVTERVGVVSAVDVRKISHHYSWPQGADGKKVGFRLGLYQVAGERGKVVVEVKKMDGERRIELTQMHDL